MTQTHKVRAWIFTLNNYTPEDCEKFINFKDNKQIKYFICGKEIAPTTGTPHIQGYIHFVNAKTREQTRKFISLRAHLKKAKGEDVHNQAYCSKENLLCEYGTPAQPGKRNDLTQLRELVNNNVRIDDVVSQCTNYQQIRYTELLFKYKKMPPKQKRVIKWYYGISGTGKTYTAIEESNEDYYITMNTLKWWDGYTGQKYIIIDELRANTCEFQTLLRLLDMYPYRIETKGGSMWIQPTTTHIIITSSQSPRDMYIFKDEELRQLLRRIDEIKEFTEVFKKV